MIHINGIALPAPSDLFVRAVPKGGTMEYNSLGQMVRDGMQEKRHVEITWRRMPSSVLSQLAQILNESGFFTLVYPDPLTGNREMECYVVEHSSRVWQYEAGQAFWADIKLSLEER